MGRVAKPTKEKQQPKRSRSAFFCFSDAVRVDCAARRDPELTGKSMAVASKVLSARWRALSAEERKPFEEQAVRLKAEFQAQREPTTDAKKHRTPLPKGWRAVRCATTGRFAFLCVPTGTCQWERPVAADAVALPPPAKSGLRLFSDDLRAEGRYTSTEAALAAWKTLSVDARSSYASSARASKVAYDAACGATCS
jgi:hypothetical protein